MIESFGDLLARWTAAELSADLGISQPTAASMKWRESVAPSHWPLLVHAAERRGIAIDEAMLARFWRTRKFNGAKRKLSGSKEAAE